MKCRTVSELIEELNKYQDWDLNLPISVTIDPHGKLLIDDEKGLEDLNIAKENLRDAASYLEDAMSNPDDTYNVECALDCVLGAQDILEAL